MTNRISNKLLDNMGVNFRGMIFSKSKILMGSKKTSLIVASCTIKYL